MWFVCLSVGLALLVTRYRGNLFRSIKQLYCRRKKGEDKPDDEVKISFDRVFLVDTPEKCINAVHILKDTNPEAVLGLATQCTRQRSLSMLQIATRSGMCILIRVDKMGSQLPSELKRLLHSTEQLKVGTDMCESRKRVARLGDTRLMGTVDLQLLAERLLLPSSNSLKELSTEYLGFVGMDKVSDVEYSNWNAETLTDEQTAYASFRALASVQVYHKILDKAKKERTWWQVLTAPLRYLKNNKTPEDYFGLPEKVIDFRYEILQNQVQDPSNNCSEITNNNCDTNDNSTVVRKLNEYLQNDMSFKAKLDDCSNEKSEAVNDDVQLEQQQEVELPSKGSVPTRNRPLYHNCYLEAPDGDILCTCDKKKAEWYVAKNLGIVVKKDPLTVRLKFEPSGRALGNVGQYYTQVKENRCVVCGASEKFVRKNVVPREYRKIFPDVMKSHQSHDVLLLCPKCHEESTRHDVKLRKQLARECDIPSKMLPISVEYAKQLNSLRSTMDDLVNNKQVDNEKKTKLEHLFRMVTGQTITFENLCRFCSYFVKNSEASGLLRTSSPKRGPPHGTQVVQYYETIGGGLVELEKRWRQHFLDTMNPKYMPDLWSVSHNQERLKMRHHENRIEPSDAKMAGLIS